MEKGTSQEMVGDGRTVEDGKREEMRDEGRRMEKADKAGTRRSSNT